MTSYGIKLRRKEENFFADIRTEDGAVAWEHVRTNLGRNVAYGMIARHWADDGKIEGFRDQYQATSRDEDGIAQGSDGILRKNVWAGYSTAAECTNI